MLLIKGNGGKLKRRSSLKILLTKHIYPSYKKFHPGELQAAENAKNFTIELVKKWLVTYKFKKWETHSTNNKPVTKEEKESRANEIATALSNHSEWLTHARSLKIQDLRNLKLKIKDYSEIPDLNDAIMRYFVLLQMTFQANIYKIFETKDSQIYRFINQNIPIPNLDNQANSLVIEIPCKKCNYINKVGGGLGRKIKIRAEHIPFPKDNILKCSKCGNEMNITEIRRSIEAQTKKVVF